MPGLSNADIQKSHDKLNEFLTVWPLERIKNMTLEEYTDIDNHNTFCYWLEFETEILGRISGKPSNKFGIWKRKKVQEITSIDYRSENGYAWYKKYGDTPNDAFNKVRSIIIDIINYAQAKQFDKIDGIDLDSLARWKIAFIYSDYNLLPIYKKDIVRTIARHFEHNNYRRARLSDLHKFIVAQKPIEEDFFSFSYNQYVIATTVYKRNYYIIGSKYGEGNEMYDISEVMYQKNAIATGYFWHIDFSHLVGQDFNIIYSWIDKNITDKSGKYETAKRALGYFLNIKPGDLVAVKSHGQFGNLTIIAYAEVVEVDGIYYEWDGDDFPDGLGQTIKVQFLEKNLWIDTGLSYGQTIHKIIPNEKQGHFEKIFGSYAIADIEDEDSEAIETFIENEIEEDILDENRINEKETTNYERTVSSSQIVTRTHNKIQIIFAKKLSLKYPNDSVRTEHKYIDIKRENANEIHLYEVKPYTSVYACIRSGIGQLIDYSFGYSKPNKTTTLYIVGVSSPNDNDFKFIDYLKQTLNINFDYLTFDSL